MRAFILAVTGVMRYRIAAMSYIAGVIAVMLSCSGLRSTGPEFTSNEPSGMTVISDRSFDAPYELGWSDSFSSPDGGSMAFMTDPTTPQSPAGVLRATWPAGFTSAGTGPGSSSIGLGNRRTIYIAYWAKLSANFFGHDSEVNKQFYMHTALNAPVFYFSATGTGTASLIPQIRVQSTVSRGTSNLSPNLVPGARIPRDRWYKIEVVAVGNTPGAVDGSVDWYLDGVHIGGVAMQWETGATTWGRFRYTTIWGGVGGPNVPATMTMDWDHAYLSGKD